MWARPSGLRTFEATFAFTFITARRLVVFPRETLSIGFRVLVSRHPAIQTTGLLTFAPAGLSPAEHASLRWTHTRTCGIPASGSSRARFARGGISVGRASAGRGGVGTGCTKRSGCSTATERCGQPRKSLRQDRSHKPWGEASRRAQCEEIRMLRSTRRGLETRHGRDGVTLADERASQQAIAVH